MSGPLRSAGNDAVELDVQVVPRASRSRVVGQTGERLKVQLAAPPVDGAANAELCEVLADALDVPRRAITLLRGATGKRKTLRIDGVDLASACRRLGLLAVALAALLPVGAGCSPITTQIAVSVLLPEDTTVLERTNNVSLVLEPDGLADTVATEGLEFSISFELPSGDARRALSLFLAEDETLLGWGRTPEVSLRTAPGVEVFIAPPGGISALPGEFSAPDPDARAATLRDVGVVVVASDGGTLFLDAFDYEVVVASTLPEPPAPDDGVLVPDPGSGVQRIWGAEALSAWRYDPSQDEWSQRALGEHDIGPRPNAAWVPDEAADQVLVIGGGDALDVVAIATDPETSDPVRRVEGLALDQPRPGAHAIRVQADAGPFTLDRKSVV